MSGDCIPSAVYKYLPFHAINLLRRLFINIYLTSTVPDDWQISSIVEIFKSGDVEDPSRFRPISLLGGCYKIFQQLFYYHRLKHLLFASQRQHGFQSRRSTITQLKSVLGQLDTFIDSYGHVSGVAMDLSQAFDTMRHDTIARQIINHTSLSALDMNLLRTIVTNHHFISEEMD